MLDAQKGVSVYVHKQYIHTLKNSRIIQKTVKSGKVYSFSTVIVFTSASESLNVAFIGPRKLGIAVQRNYAKRLLRAAFREAMKHTALPEVNIVIMARSYIFKSDFRFLIKELQQILYGIQANALKGESK